MYREEPKDHRSPGLCPRCDVPLTPRLAGGVKLGVCQPCGGIWIHGLGLLALILGEDDELAQIADRVRGKAPGNASAAGPCPKCRAEMETSMGASGITRDFCKNHGYWFDRGEFAAVVDYMRVNAPKTDDEEERGFLDALRDWFGGRGVPPKD